VYNIWILTSLAFGGATSTSSILRGSPAPQQTAALHLIVVPAVDDIEKTLTEVGSSEDQTRSKLE
jgi:hypothetical protein